MRASSEYFHILLGPNFREGTEENVVLKEIDGETLKSIIHFVYHREITIDHGNFINILRASSWMGLTDLQNRCASFGIGVNAENCIEILLIADGFDKLKSIAFDVICENFEKLPYDEIEEIDEANYEKLLMCDQLSGAETDIFNGLVHWISINKAEGDICISKLLKQIRLKNIPKAVRCHLFCSERIWNWNAIKLFSGFDGLGRTVFRETQSTGFDFRRILLQTESPEKRIHGPTETKRYLSRFHSWG